MKRLALALLVLATACSGDDGEAAVTKYIAVQTRDGNIHVVDPETGVETALTADGGIETHYSQPTWSPDGFKLAFVENTAADAPGEFADGSAVRTAFEAQAINSSIHVVSMDDEKTDVEIETPFTGFYLYWSPDGSSLAFLGNDLAGIGLGVVDIATARARRIDQGQPYYFAWSPDSERILAHVGEDQMYFVGTDGQTEPLAVVPGAFTAPSWEGNSVLYSIVGEDGSELVLAGPNREVKRQIHKYSQGIEAVLSSDGETVAYVDVGSGSSQLTLGSLVVDTSEGAVEVVPEVAVFFWSSDGLRLLYLEPDRTTEDLRLRWGVWQRDATFSFDGFLPSPTLIARYFPFFGQYSNSHSFFSPDGESFVFAGDVGAASGIWIQEVAHGVDARRLTDGVLATWAP